MEFFTLNELIRSETANKLGIDNIPSKEEELNLVALVDNILDPLRKAYGKPIIVSSGYRCLKLNKAVGGARTSQHVSGQASDIRSKEDTRAENKKLFDLIISLKLPFDLLINEYNYDWVHVSYSNRNRRLILNIK